LCTSPPVVSRPVAFGPATECEAQAAHAARHVRIVRGHELHRFFKGCDGLVKIPMPGDIESLNVSVATGVTLFEAVRQRMG
jgi:tRNA G18 (ribose-2'-O)-methylase SpoU